MHAEVITVRTRSVPSRTTASLMEAISLDEALNAEFASWMTLVASTGSFETALTIAGTSASGSIARRTISCADAGSMGIAVSASSSRRRERIQSLQSVRDAVAVDEAVIWLPNRHMPRGLEPYIEPGFLDPASCARIRAAMDRGAPEPAEILQNGVALDN